MIKAIAIVFGISAAAILLLEQMSPDAILCRLLFRVATRAFVQNEKAPPVRARLSRFVQDDPVIVPDRSPARTGSGSATPRAAPPAATTAA